MLNFFLVRIKKVFIYIKYNLILQNFSKDYLTSKNIFSTNPKKNSYIKFLIKCLIKKKIRIQKFKFFYICLISIIYEISASCWSLKKQVFINNKVNEEANPSIHVPRELTDGRHVRFCASPAR
jgi:hypothetical protein